MNSFYMKFVIALILVVFGLAVAAAGIYIGETDDAPGAALIGILIALGMIVFAVGTATSKTGRR